jgi:Protein of unknown function (DUF2971)
MARNAIAAGITRLYHYDKFVPEYLEDLLTNQRVHFANLANLNDPWDCRPWFDPTVLEEAQVLEQFAEWIFSFAPTSPVSEEQRLATEIRMRVDPAYRRGILERFSSDFLRMIPNRWRIYCLTPIPDSTLMWSHYADNHRGIVLEYSTDNAVFGIAQEVQYLSSYPRWSPHDLMTKSTVQLLLTKSDDWEYEREYRVIGFAEGVERAVMSHPLILKGPYLGLPNGALKSVIAGCESELGIIQELVQRCLPSLPVKRAVRASDRYKLTIAV